MEEGVQKRKENNEKNVYKIRKNRAWAERGMMEGEELRWVVRWMRGRLKGPRKYEQEMKMIKKRKGKWKKKKRVENANPSAKGKRGIVRRWKYM